MQICRVPYAARQGLWEGIVTVIMETQRIRSSSATAVLVLGVVENAVSGYPSRRNSVGLIRCCCHVSRAESAVYNTTPLLAAFPLC